MLVKTETRGRKALPIEQRKAPQATLKINAFILPFVKELKSNLKKGRITKKTIDHLFNALNNNREQMSALPQDETINHDQTLELKNEVQRLKNSLAKAHQANAIKPLESNERLQLVDKYQVEHLKVVDLESRQRSNTSTIKSLMAKIESLERIEHGCQALKSNGARCTRIAKTRVNRQGIDIHVCSQHAKE